MKSRSFSRIVLRMRPSISLGESCDACPRCGEPEAALGERLAYDCRAWRPEGEEAAEPPSRAGELDEGLAAGERRSSGEPKPPWEVKEAEASRCIESDSTVSLTLSSRRDMRESMDRASVSSLRISWVSTGFFLLTVLVAGLAAGFTRAGTLVEVRASAPAAACRSPWAPLGSAAFFPAFTFPDRRARMRVSAPPPAETALLSSRPAPSDVPSGQRAPVEAYRVLACPCGAECGRAVMGPAADCTGFLSVVLAGRVADSLGTTRGRREFLEGGLIL